MQKTKSLYHGHRFPAAAISQEVRRDFRFQLILRDVEELLFERGVIVSYETIRPDGHPNCPTYGHPNCSTWVGVN